MSSGLRAEYLLDIVGHNHFLVYQHLRELFESGPVVFENPGGALRDLVHDGLGLGVDQLRGLLAVRFREVEASAAGGVVEGEVPQLVAHSVVGDHSVRHLGHPLEVVERPGARYAVVDEFLGDASSDQAAHLVHHIGLGHHHLFVRQAPGEAEGLSARDNRNLEHWVAARKQPSCDSVSGFVVRSEPLLLRGHNRLLPLYTAYNSVDRIGEVLVVNVLLAPARRRECGFVADVGYVSPGKSRCVFGYRLHVEVRGEFEFLGVYEEYLLALVEIREGYLYLAVEASGPHKSLVKYVCAVGCGQHDDSAVGAETVHLRKELIESVLPFVIGGESHILASGPAHRVYLVDEDYAGGLLLGLREEIPHAARTHSDEHLHEVGAADAEERHVCLSGHGLGEQGLAGTRRPHEQGSFRYLAAEGGVFARILEEVHDFHHLLLRAVEPGHVLEGDIDLVLVRELARSLADIERIHPAAGSAPAAHLARHRTEHPRVQHNQECYRQHPLQHSTPDVGLVLDIDLYPGFFRKPGVQLAELLFRVELGRGEKKELRGLLRELPVREHPGILSKTLRLDAYVALEVVPDEADVLDVPFPDHRLDLIPFDFLGRGGAVVQQHPSYHREEYDIEECGKVDSYHSASPVVIVWFLSHRLYFCGAKIQQK